MRSSVVDDPVSEDAARSTDDGDGAVASTDSDSDGTVATTLPAGSVRVPDTDHVPSVSAGDKSHDVVDPMVYEQLRVTEPFVAEMVATSPVEPPGMDNVGVVSLVRLSEFDAPESDDATRSGPPENDGAVPSI